MGKVTGFMEFVRELPEHAPVPERLHHWHEFEHGLPEERIRNQGARCMDCGIPFCHTGCPLGNRIPDWNDLVYRNRWREAIDILHATNNFPEFTGRVCPAPCEPACVLSINREPVAIKLIEVSTIDRAFAEGWVPPQPPRVRTGRTVVVVGSGPAGLACAQQLSRAGHTVTVVEKADRLGGLLRYGIPDFKMEKRLIDRRLRQMEQEGVLFKRGVHVGVDVSAIDLRRQCDALCLCGGAEQPRDLQAPGRELRGVHFAMDFLTQQNRRLAGDAMDPDAGITAQGKHVIVLGGGDTGSDCVGTSHRQGAASVTSFELVPRPPDQRPPENPWPQWPLVMRTSSSHEEGGTREYGVLTKALAGEHGQVCRLHAVRVALEPPDEAGHRALREIPGSEFSIPADLVLLAMGFVHPVHEGLLEQLGVALTDRGAVQADEESYMTDVPGVFAAGDIRRGQSLVVWAIAEGRRAARAIDLYLMGSTMLP